MIEETRGRIDYDECIVRGGESPQAMQRASTLVSERTRGSTLATIDGAAHFMIATHASGVAGLICTARI